MFKFFKGLFNFIKKITAPIIGIPIAIGYSAFVLSLYSVTKFVEAVELSVHKTIGSSYQKEYKVVQSQALKSFNEALWGQFKKVWTNYAFAPYIDAARFINKKSETFINEGSSGNLPENQRGVSTTTENVLYGVKTEESRLSAVADLRQKLKEKGDPSKAANEEIDRAMRKAATSSETSSTKQPPPQITRPTSSKAAIGGTTLPGGAAIRGS